MVTAVTSKAMTGHLHRNPWDAERTVSVCVPVQLRWIGVYSGLRVWMIFGLGLFVLSISSSSSSSSWSLSHTWTTTLGVVSVAACSSYFSPGEMKQVHGEWRWGSRMVSGAGACPGGGQAGTWEGTRVCLATFCLTSDGLRDLARPSLHLCLLHGWLIHKMEHLHHRVAPSQPLRACGRQSVRC